MPFLILLSAIIGTVVSLLYYPSSPIYIFHNVILEEVWLWSKYSAFLAALLFIFTLLAFDNDIKGRDVARSLSAFVMVLQGILNLPPAISYAIFLRGSMYTELTARGGTIFISYKWLLLHIAVIVVSWATAVYLALRKKKQEFDETFNLPDAA
ncbi:MAG: hypothetical protein K6T91_01270 [Firmicutes bacterium]|nr:hypothetical protein [Bacillota bacterium]